MMKNIYEEMFLNILTLTKQDSIDWSLSHRTNQDIENKIVRKLKSSIINNMSIILLEKKRCSYYGFEKPEVELLVFNNNNELILTINRSIIHDFDLNQLKDLCVSKSINFKRLMANFI